MGLRAGPDVVPAALEDLPEQRHGDRRQVGACTICSGSVVVVTSS
jgi:hypothetical protein